MRRFGIFLFFYDVSYCTVNELQWLLSTPANKQGVDISITVLLFVCNFVILYGYGFLLLRWS